MKEKVAFILVIALFLFSCSKSDDISNNASLNKEISSLNDIEGSTIAVLLGSVQDLYLTENCQNCNLIRLGTPSDLIASVDNGIADYLAMDSVMIIGSESEGLQACFNLEIPFDIGVAFNKSNVTLCSQFNDFLESIKKDGIYDQMNKRWICDSIAENLIPKIDVSKNGEPLSFGIMPTFPFEYVKDGEWTGFEIEMLERFAKYLNRPIKFITYDFPGLMAAVATNKVDGICSFICITEERSKQVLFSKPYYTTYSYLFKDCGDTNSSSFFNVLKKSFVNNLITEDRWKLIVNGLWETLVISSMSILLGILIGIVICAIRMSKYRIISNLSRIFVDIIRGMPILVFLMVMFYIIFADSEITARKVSIIAFAFYFGAYTSEMFRSGILTVDKGQTEAGIALGFTRVGTFINFVIPTALKNILPVFKGEAVSLIKNTSVVGYIGVQDLTKVSDMIRARTFDAFFPLIIISIIYFILAWMLGKLIEELAEKI